MYHARKTKSAVVATIGVSALSLLLIRPATADDQARPGDVVGVGSDTVQFAADFIADGDVAGDAGFNAGSAGHRMMSYFATGDGNGRALYDNTGALLYGNGTTSVVLRAGTLPVERPDGSGAGIGALTADSTGQAAGINYDGLPNGSINFVRASRLPKAAENTACVNITGCGGLHVFQYASDNLEIAKWTGGTSNAVPLSAQDLLSIYTCKGSGTNGAMLWNQLTGNSTGSADPIDALIPQSGSGTRAFFLSDLASVNGGVVPTPGACVRTTEEHDPTGITLDPHPADAIEPFSVAKVLLLQSGYFNNSQVPAGSFAIGPITGCTGETVAGQTNDQGACGTTGLNANGGTPLKAGDGNIVYDSVRGLYFIVREHDRTSTVKFPPGSTTNFDQALFDGVNSEIASPFAAPLIQAAGMVPAYADLGNLTSG